MKALFKLCLPLLAAALLASCGGGGGDGHGGFTPPASGMVTLQAETQNLPLNTAGVLPNPGGPFTSEVTITLRRRDGSLITDVDKVGVHISPVSVAAFSTLDDPATQDINEIQVLLGDGPVDVVAGKATVFVTSQATSGTATLTVTSPDSGNLQIQSAKMDFTVGNVAAPVPADISLSSNYPGVYLASSGGRSSTLLTAFVSDAGGHQVPDPASANVQFEVVGGASNGSLSGNSGNGQSINVKTTNGIATASFRAGSAQGPVTVKATADAADNDVSNGIQDPVSATISIVVSDGQLYSLEITSPVFATKLPGITVNALPVSDNTQPASNSTSMIPPNPDATLSLTVSALATDRQGNPVLQGTTIHFGSVDEPVADFDPNGGGNYFQISGNDGNPQEGGTLFTAPTGHFTTAGGGAGPGDALVVFGKAVEGNADLESAMTVSTINSQTSLRTSSAFNQNDTTGASVDYGAVLPYLIGRAMHGNITATGTTNDVGVASAKLTYTVNTVGHAVAIWAQGAGADRVTDALTLTYPGVAPATLTAYPSPIPGNTTYNVTTCISDALGIPIQGVQIGFAFQLNGGSGSVDGISGSGALQHYTDASGCSVAQVQTSGIPASASGASSGTLLFSAGGATAEVEIVVGVGFLSASRSSVCAAQTQGDDVTVTAYSDGNPPQPVAGVNISASCDAGIAATPNSGTTGSNGGVSFHLLAQDMAHGTCTFTSSGGASAQITVRGANDGFSPPCNNTGP